MQNSCRFLRQNSQATSALLSRGCFHHSGMDTFASNQTSFSSGSSGSQEETTAPTTPVDENYTLSEIASQDKTVRSEKTYRRFSDGLDHSNLSSLNCHRSEE